MLNFIQKITYFILNIQNNLISKKLKTSLKSTFSHTTSKRFFTKGTTVEFTAQTELAKTKQENNVSQILEKAKNKPEVLINFIKRNSTPVYKLKYANLVMKALSMETGFISQTKGLKALILTTCLSVFAKENVNVAFETEPMFVIEENFDKYRLIQHFYKWYGMRLNLPGYDYNSQNNFNKFLQTPNADLKQLGIDEILGLKEAIARDVEAINFVVKLAKSTECSKSALEKLKAAGASI